MHIVYLHPASEFTYLYLILLLFSNIKIAPVGVSKAVKKLAKSKLPDLSKYKDISDFVLR